MVESGIDILGRIGNNMGPINARCVQYRLNTLNGTDSVTYAQYGWDFCVRATLPLVGDEIRPIPWAMDEGIALFGLHEWHRHVRGLNDRGVVSGYGRRIAGSLPDFLPELQRLVSLSETRRKIFPSDPLLYRVAYGDSTGSSDFVVGRQMVEESLKGLEQRLESSRMPLYDIEQYVGVEKDELLFKLSFPNLPEAGYWQDRDADYRVTAADPLHVTIPAFNSGSTSTAVISTLNLLGALKPIFLDVVQKVEAEGSAIIALRDSYAGVSEKSRS
jgi:hypothetical protein